METNPYFELINLMGGIKTDVSLHVYEGKVLSISPLAIATADLTLEADALMVNDELVTPRDGTISGNGRCAYNTSNVTGTCRVPPTLAVGDTVLLFSLDNQKFYVLMKAVKV